LRFELSGVVGCTTSHHKFYGKNSSPRRWRYPVEAQVAGHFTADIICGTLITGVEHRYRMIGRLI
jgi:hypothetical protein